MTNFTVLCAAAASVAAALLLAGCNEAAAPAAVDTAAAAQTLKDNEAQWNQDFASKDAGKMAAHYADDAVLMSPGMPPSSGKDAIRKTLDEMVKDPALSLKFQASHVEVAKGGDIGFTQGSYTMTMTDPGSKQVIHDHGSYVTTYRKQADGTWKAVSDIASSESPMAAPPVTTSAPAPAPVAAK